MSESHVPEAGYSRVFTHSSGGLVELHELHGKQEKPQNLAIARWLATQGEQVRLLPVSTSFGVKTPDATRNGVAWEFKVPTGQTANAIDKALRDGSKQASRILIRPHPDFDVPTLEQAMFDRVQRAVSIREVAILLGEKLVHFARQEITENTFRGKLA